MKSTHNLPIFFVSLCVSLMNLFISSKFPYTINRHWVFQPKWNQKYDNNVHYLIISFYRKYFPILFNFLLDNKTMFLFLSNQFVWWKIIYYYNGRKKSVMSSTKNIQIIISLLMKCLIFLLTSPTKYKKGSPSPLPQIECSIPQFNTKILIVPKSWTKKGISNLYFFLVKLPNNKFICIYRFKEQKKNNNNNNNNSRQAASQQTKIRIRA